VVQPHIDLPQRLGIHRVEPTSPHSPNRGEPVLPQHPQVLGDSGLGDPELLLDNGDDGTGRLLAGGEQLQDATANRIAKNVERMHSPTVPFPTYISQCRCLAARTHGQGCSPPDHSPRNHSASSEPEEQSLDE
jgi:hypothetical protein